MCPYAPTAFPLFLPYKGNSPLFPPKAEHNFRSCKGLLSDVDYALCEYAWFVTANPREIDAVQVEKLREVGLNDHEILEAAFVAGFFNYTNRWVSTIAPVANSGHFSHNRNFD